MHCEESTYLMQHVRGGALLIVASSAYWLYMPFANLLKRVEIFSLEFHPQKFIIMFSAYAQFLSRNGIATKM